jgi:hypothetical protein
MMKKSYFLLRLRFLRWSLILILVLVAATLMPQPARASENHCILPDGTDLNALYGISAQIVNPFCNQVDSGEHWTIAGPAWFMNTSFEVVPVGFVPAGATPLEDFLAKFVAIKHVIDPGTLQERTYIYPVSNDLWIGTIEGFPGVWPGTLSIARPLSVGDHVVEVYWIFSAMHCDGFGDVVEFFCLGPGEVEFIPPRPFEVTPGALQSQD